MVKEAHRKIRLGVLPTQRFNFGSKEKTMKAKNRVLEWLKENEINTFDLEGVTEDGTLHSMNQLSKVVSYLKENDVEALFVPHCNFGTEEIIAEVTKEINKPLLIWGETDDRERTGWDNLTDRQCGLFATSKVLNRFNVRFSYIVNSSINSPEFEEGFARFLGVASVVKAFYNIRIGMIDTRPAPFLSVMSNEGELLEKFGIRIVPTSLGTIVNNAKKIEGADKHRKQIDIFKEKITVWEPDEETTSRLAAFKLSMENWSEENYCNALVIQCWPTLQEIYSIMPCFGNSELAGSGLPVGCESDVHGVITSVMLEAAAGNESPSFFADLTVRHPDNKNAELLWHCGPFPCQLADLGVTKRVGPQGRGNWRIKDGELTLSRFDGVHGDYSLLIGEAKTVPGPETFGTYLWAEVSDWPSWEKELIYGPYAHHIVGVYGRVSSIMEEACRYIPDLKPNIME
jgi:L-fucose isomerase-like protein